MTEPHLGDDAEASRRVRRTWKKQQRIRRIATIAAGVLIAAGFALFATETVRFGGGDRPTFAGAVHAQPAASTSSTTTTLPGRKCRAPLTDPDPLRLWVGGDSLAGSLGPSLGTIAGATGVVQPYFDSRVSSGLMSPTFFDWPTHAEKEMARLNPEIAVFIIGANDFLAPVTPVTSSTTTSIAPSTSAGVNPSSAASANTTTSPDDPWKVDYAQRVEAMLATLSAPGRTVVWVGPPPFKNDHDNLAIQQISEISKAVIARHPDAVFVDDYAMFLDANGKYADRLPDANGNMISVRSGDGVHFTTEGGNQLARAVYGLIDAQCKITAQAVAGVTKQTIQTEGSTLVAPGSNNRQGGTVATTPPATSPPATSPPATTPPATTAPPQTVPPATTTPPATTAPPATTLPPPTTT
jgi:hypothetical protein